MTDKPKTLDELKDHFNKYMRNEHRRKIEKSATEKAAGEDVKAAKADEGWYTGPPPPMPPTAAELNAMGATHEADAPHNGRRYLVLIGLKEHGFDKESYWTIGYRFDDKWFSCWDGPELNYVSHWRELPPVPHHLRLRGE